MTGGQRVFAGLVSGAAVGFGLARWAPDRIDAVEAIAKPLGTLWLHALQMTVVPLVVSLIVVGVTQAADVAAGGRIARRTLGWILALAVASAALTVIVAPRLFAACPRGGDLVESLQRGTARSRRSSCSRWRSPSR